MKKKKLRTIRCPLCEETHETTNEQIKYCPECRKTYNPRQLYKQQQKNKQPRNG